MADGSTSSPQDDLKDAIKQNAEGPRQATADGLSVDVAANAEVRRIVRKLGRYERT